MATKTYTIGITTAGSYDPAVTYKKLARVYDPVTDCSYLSRVAGNVGHPVTDETYWQKDKSDLRPTIVEHSSNTVSINPYVMNVWPTAHTSLTVTLLTGMNGKENEYKMEFVVSGDNFSLTFNGQTVRWVEEPDWNNGWTYQVSILNGLAVAAGWEAAQS